MDSDYPLPGCMTGTEVTPKTSILLCWHEMQAEVVIE